MRTPTDCQKPVKDMASRPSTAKDPINRELAAISGRKTPKSGVKLHRTLYVLGQAVRGHETRAGPAFHGDDVLHRVQEVRGLVEALYTAVRPGAGLAFAGYRPRAVCQDGTAEGPMQPGHILSAVR